MTNCPADRAPRGFNPIATLALVLLVGLLMQTDANASTADDAKTVAALDTEYQAAVEKNDVATMARILAEDFTLVTGRGKVFTKTDLLESARINHEIYERQVEEPGTQKVRVW